MKDETRIWLQFALNIQWGVPYPTLIQMKPFATMQF